MDDDDLPTDLAAVAAFAVAVAVSHVYDYSNVVFAVYVDHIYNNVDVEMKKNCTCSCFDIDLCYFCHIVSFDSSDECVTVAKEWLRWELVLSSDHP